MNIKIYQVDAFTSKVFKGNPAAVIILKKWMKDSMMQKISYENNLSETAFAVPSEEGYEIRWFTPEVEVDLCGHATLATAHVLWKHLGYAHDEIVFHSSHSGILYVRKTGKLLGLDFPADRVEKMEIPSFAKAALGVSPQEAFRGKSDLMFLFGEERSIREVRPDFALLPKLGGRGVIVTAPGEEVDFVSRFFAPQSGIDEDPVTGSAHTTLTPYWSGVLKKEVLSARQISRRGGELLCEDCGERVKISGEAVTYMTGEIYI